MRTVIFSLLGVWSLVCSTPTLAVPVTWMVAENTFFGDGGTLAGHFTYDADTGEVTNAYLTTGGGSILSGYTYTTVIATLIFPDGATDDPPGVGLYWLYNVTLQSNGEVAPDTYAILSLDMDPITNYGWISGFDENGLTFDRSTYLRSDDSAEWLCIDQACPFTDGIENYRGLIHSELRIVPTPASLYLLVSALALLVSPLLRRTATL